MTKIEFKNLPDTSTPLNAENLNQLQDNVEAAIPVLDDQVSTSSTNGVQNQAITNYVNTKGIYESGSNANGSYIKYDDGTMICYAYKSASFGSWSSQGNLYMATNTSNITFPQTFYDTPIVTLTQNPGDRGASYWQCWSGRIINDTSKISYIQLWRPTTATENLDIDFSYIAIGRWKA